MRLFFLISALSMVAPGSAFAQDSKTPGQAKRNVLLIVADDLGMDLGCYGNQAIRTPNLDALAKKGIRFSKAYATVSSCSPSRASILTGMFTHQNGQYGLQHAAHNQQAYPWVQGLPNLLRAAGYWTGLIGKFHVGPASSFDFNSVMIKGLAGNRDVAAMAKQAREFITKAEKRPFFLYYAFGDPHRAGKGFGNEPYAKSPAEVNYDPDKVIVPYHLPDNAEVRRELAEYYQSVSRMDRGVGMLLDVLRETGQLDDTIIIFISDNGIPFPGAKTTLYNSGIHLPLILSVPTSPTKGEGNRTNNNLVSYVDLVPTILDWTKAKGPSYKLPGRSLLPILDQESAKGFDAVFASHQFHEITMYYPMRAVVTAKHKYIVNLAHELEYPQASDLWGSTSWQGIRKRGDKMMGQRSVTTFLHRPREELYDLSTDPNELRNLAAMPEHAATLTELRQRMQRWRTETDDPWLIMDRDAK
jgi:N-sulfoglucosamine sulfohydrolase